MEWEVKIVHSKKPMDIHHVSHLLADIILRSLNKEFEDPRAFHEPGRHTINMGDAEPRRSQPDEQGQPRSSLRAKKR